MIGKVAKEGTYRIYHLGKTDILIVNSLCLGDEKMSYEFERDIIEAGFETLEPHFVFDMRIRN